jgi:Transglutaminase-like superfamily
MELSPAESRAIHAAEVVFRNYPFGRASCLRRSLVLGSLLHRHRPVLRLGAVRSGVHLEAHAWLEVAGIPILDDAPVDQFAPLTNGAGARVD